MALTRSISRLDLAPMPQTVGDSIGIDRGALLALSQRKLNALGMPLAYIDRNQRYRFANKAFLDWFGKRPDEVLGREVIEVLGRESYQLYRAYIDAALGGERPASSGNSRCRAASRSGCASTTTRIATSRATCAASSSPTATSIT